MARVFYFTYVISDLSFGSVLDRYRGFPVPRNLYHF